MLKQIGSIIGWIGTALVFGAAIGSLMAGTLSDKYGRRTTLMGLSLVFLAWFGRRFGDFSAAQSGAFRLCGAVSAFTPRRIKGCDAAPGRER